MQLAFSNTSLSLSLILVAFKVYSPNYNFVQYSVKLVLQKFQDFLAKIIGIPVYIYM